MPKLTKAFDKINMVSDKVFLAHCTCHGDVCNCSHDGQHLFTASNKDTEMKFSDIKAVTSELTIAEKQQLLESLSKDVSAAVAKADGSKQRLESVKAASISKDPRVSGAFKLAKAGLQRLGLDIEAIAASGATAEIDNRARQYKWNSDQRIALKHSLSIVGAI